MKSADLRLRMLFVALSIMAIMSSVVGGYLYYSALIESSEVRMHTEAKEYLQGLSQNLDSYLSWSLLSVKTVAGLKGVTRSLTSKDPEALAEANAILDHFCDVLKVSVCYLMDDTGKTIASSNRYAPDAFVGKNYAFRPYFKQSMEGRSAVHMALGVTSKKRGIYYSHPVYGDRNQRPLGVAVIKSPLGSIEKDLIKSQDGIVLLTDPNGVVFVSSRSDWLYHFLWKASSEKISKITKTRQFGTGPWNWTGMKRMDQDHAVDDLGNEYRIHDQELATYPGWRLVYLHSHSEVMKKIINPLRKSVGFIVVMLCLFFGIIVFSLFMKANRSIVKREKAENELKKSKEELKSIFKAAPTGIGLVVDRVIEHVNDRVCDMTGYSRSELIGQNASIFYPSMEDYEYVGREKYRQITERGTGTVETRFKRKNGEIINVLMSSTPLDPANLLAGVTFTALDITDRKQTEEKLRKSEERYRAYFEENISGAYISTPEGQLIACNNEYKNIFGFDSTQHALATPIGSLSKDPDERVEFLDLLKKEKRVAGYEPHLKKVDGTPIHLVENASGVFDEAGRLIRIRGFISDVSKQRKLETQLQQAQKMEAIGTLAGGIAHDFNNILFPVLGHTEILLQDISEDSPIHSRLKKIYAGALRARDLVKQILTFSRQDGFELMTMKLQPIIKEALKFTRSTIPTTIEIQEEISLSCGSVKADATQIYQIVMNLTTNAYHAMSKTGGILKVSLKEIEIDGGETTPSNMEPGTYACLTVADTGIGMDKELMEKIFDPFFTTKEKGKGTGMGLSVVHGIVAGMNGVLHADSEPGKGTQFNIYLPVEKRVLVKQDTQIKDPAQGGTEHILLVDDEDDIVKLGKQMLSRLGYQVDTITNSIDALEKFRETPDRYDLVITDMAMPHMSGDKLAVELINIRPGIPILLCTGFSETVSEEKIALLGIKGFLTKPISMKNLSRKVRQLLDEAVT